MHSLIKNLDRSLAKYLAGLLPEERRYLLLVPVTGIVAGAAAVALEKLLAVIQAAFWGTSHEIGAAASRMAETSPWTLLLILATGGLVVVVANLFLRKGNRLQGTSRLMEALAFKKGRLPVLETLLEGVVSITAVGAGASLGREGAMMNSGATLGSWLGAKLHLEDHHVKVLLASGAAGGIAAAYNVPISASVFAMEVILGSFALELFGPIIVCSLISPLISPALSGTGPV